MLSQQNRDDELVLPEGLRLRPVDPVLTQFGAIRSVSSLTRVEIAFLVVALTEICMSLGYSVEKIAASSISILPNSTEDFTLAIVLSINIGFCFIYIINGVLTEKPYELIIFLIANLIVFGYVVGNYAFRCVQYLNPDDVFNVTSPTPFLAHLTTTTARNVTDNTNYCLDGVKLSRFILTCLFTPPALALGVYLTRDYMDRGEFIFRTVGADASLQTACKRLFATISIIKLDLQLQLSMFVLILREGHSGVNLLEMLILAFGVPFSGAWALGSYLSLRWESKKVLLAIVITSLVEPAYIIYRMTVAGKEITADIHELLSFVAFMFGAGALIARAIHLILLFLCYRNFSRGLKERVFG